MEFTFSAEQDALRASVRAVLDAAVAAGAVRAFVDGDAAAADDTWQRGVALGWPALLVPEANGGLGLGLVDAVVVLEELGRATFPGPFLSSAVCATVLARSLGCDDLLAGLAAGTSRGAVALEELGHGDPVERVRTRAVRKGARWLLHGLKPVVLDGAGADWVLVAARTQEGLGSFLVEAPACEPVPAMDPTRAVARLALDAVPATPVGPPGDHTEPWRDVADAGAVALAAELAGVCDTARALTIAYADARVQFDVPISSHQVIQHKLVDMLHATELGRVGTHYAAWAFDTGDEHRRRAASIAKAAMGEAAVDVTAETIQIHGAVGFTWDADPHLLYKRAKQADLLFGSRTWHRHRIADAFLGA